MPSSTQLALMVGSIAAVLPAQQTTVQSYLDAFWRGAETRNMVSSFAATANVREAGIEGITKPGSVHHLRGQIFVPGASLANIVRRIRDYDTHAEIFSPTLRSAELCRKESDDTFVFRYWATPYRDSVTETRATHKQIDANHYVVSSVTTGLGGPGDLPDQKNLCNGALPGVFYMKQLHAVWRYEQTEAGVQIEAETVAELSGFPFVRGTVKRVLGQIMTQSLESYHRKFRGEG